MLATLTLMAAMVSGCASQGEGSASIYVKDAPTDSFDEIHVVYTKVSVHAAGDGDNDDDSDDGDNQTAGWKVLFDNASGVDIDLLNVTGDRAAFLGEDDLPAGKYTQLRVEVKQAYGVAENGSHVAITLPSGTLKFNHPFTVEADEETRLVLDFDLDASMEQQTDGSWRMTPVVGHVDAQQVDDDESGEDADSEGEVAEIDD
jgi:hypothetical protein